MNKYLWEIKRFGGFFYRAGQEFVRHGWKRRNARYARFYEKVNVNENVILYESYFGRGMLCGPYALFKEMLSDSIYVKMEHVWVLDNLEDHEDLIKEYEKYSNVRFVQYMSKAYLKELCRAKYLINNVTFPSFFTKKENQIYVNTWHGIPLKKLGFDMPDGAIATKNIIRNFLQTNYLVSANEFLTNIYRYTYKLNGLFEGTIIEDGYPRLDLLVNIDQKQIIKKLESKGVKIDTNRKIILYAPTWRENTKDPMEVLEDYRDIKEQIEEAVPQYQVLIKAHQFVYNLIKGNLKVNYIIPATIDANEVLPLADILISDYSSIFFDYLFFERPILFYIPDLEMYSKVRGLYFSLDELPGPASQEHTKIIEWVRDIDKVKAKFAEKIKCEKEKCCNYDIGNISKQVLDVIFEKNVFENHTVVKCHENGKQKVLIHRGRMRVNGISSSFLNLLNEIEYEKYDVTVVVTKSEEFNEKKLLEAINPNVRVLVRESSFNFTFLNNVRNRMMEAYGVQGFMKYVFPLKTYKNEIRRCFGDARFDIAADFEGYNVSYAMLIALVPDVIHAIWQHNDMDAERKMRFPYLKAIFSTYTYFQKIVSCCEAIMNVNRKNLATEETYHRYTYAKNMIDYKRVSDLAAEKNAVIEIDQIPYLILKNGKAGTCFTAKGIPLAVDSKETSTKILRFIAIGRLSPEKNYQNLIIAFHQFCNLGYNAMLYILGEGPERKKLEQLVKKLKMAERVILTGNLTNPIAVMEKCDCFVLPSLHEGQPMVILEARSMKKPIIMTKFSSHESSMITDGQYLVDSSAEGILEGLVAYTNGEVSADYIFDAEKYNKEAYQEFLSALELK